MIATALIVIFVGILCVAESQDKVHAPTSQEIRENGTADRLK